MRQHTLGWQYFDVFGQAQITFLELSRVDIAHVRVVAVLLLIALYRALDLVADRAGWIIVEPKQAVLNHR